MYSIIKINGNEYKFEFSIEASLYNDCIESVMGLMIDMDASGKSDRKAVLSTISDMPHVAVTCFYAGLLEHHGTEAGDGKIPNFDAAKKLAKSLLRDEESTTKNWYDLLTLCTEQMAEDGFFDLIGLTEMVGEASKRRRAPKVPQDHKKKAQTKEVSES